MDYTVAFDASAEKIYQDFTCRGYWDALMDAYGWLTPQSVITEFRSGESGTDIVFKQLLPRSELPPLARSVMPVDMVITREQHFDPFNHDDGGAAGSYRATVPAGPGYFSGHYFLTDTGSGAAAGFKAGSQLRLASVCNVRIPLIGGILEQLILSNITMLFDAEEAFAADWISKHH